MNSRSALRKAVITGELPNIKTQICVDCGEPADDYHHHNGYEPEHWLDVIPLCRTCHRNRHRGPRKAKSSEGEKVITLTTTQEDRLLLKAISWQHGSVGNSAMVRILIRREAARLGIVVPTSEKQPT